MKVTRLLADIARSILFFSILVFAASHTVQAAGVVTNCTEADLRAALTGGGTVTFACDGTITVASQVSITTNTTLDATGHNVLLSGGNAVRLFDINPGASLTLINLTLVNGRNQGFNGAAGADGGQGSAGAINIDNGTLNLIGCRIWNNTAAGGAGGNGQPEGSGGPAWGGAISMFHGTLNATNSEFVGNRAIGGPGGTNSILGLRGSRSGGQARGGAIASSGGLIQLDNCLFTSNAAIGGRAATSLLDGGDGNSGDASGGAWLNDGGTAIVTTCSFVFNNGSTPTFTNFSGGGIGGTVRGGSICSVSGAVSIFGTEFLRNSVKGGSAQRVASRAGHGQGGAIFNLDLLELRGCFFQANSANGGDRGLPGGDGLGGAVFNGGQLRIAQSEFETNSVQAGLRYQGSVSGIARGGAIFTTNSLWLNDSILHGNVASGAAGQAPPFPGPFPGYPAYGGAIYSSGTSYLTNNTFVANLASGGRYPGSTSPPSPITAGGDAYGGGLCQTGGVAFLLNNTFAANAASGGTGYPNGNSYGGGIANTNGAVTLLNTIVANNPSGSNCFGNLTDAGHNLSSDTSCNFTNTGSLNNTDPLLHPLGDFGGPTPTMPLLTGSPCIDAADPAAAPPADQRGVPRPYGLTPDIGAYEWNGGLTTLRTSVASGGSVILNPPGGTYIATNVVTVTAQPASGWYLLYWLGDGSGPSPSINVLMERDKTLHAVFGTTVSTPVVGNGSIQVFPPGGGYPFGTTVRLTAIPQPGQYFGAWGNATTGNTNPLYFTISGPNPTVSSIFVPLPADQAALTVLVSGHGRVNANPRATAYPTNQSVTLTAVPDSGQSFVNWSGDASGTQNPLVFSMTQSRVITAHFTSRPFMRVDRPGLEGPTPDGFRLTVVSDPQSVHQILASTNLNAWTSVGRVTNNFGEVQFMDTNAAGFPSKFYQAAP